MQIEMFEADGDQSFSGSPELHVRVLSDTLVDLPRVLLALSPEQQAVRAKYGSSPSYFYPADTAKESHGFKFDDEWHFRKIGHI